MNDPLIWIHLALGPFLLVVAILYLKFPPRGINHLYGYRTPRSMATQEAWDFANGLSSRWLLIASLGTIAIQVITIPLFSPENSILISAGAFLLFVMGMIPYVEIQLKKRFH